ncbi:MAG: hypothetical protein GF388_08545 [Candidatus Aegiribacteria sp.]|nr:hypothetical protein [Candidatus Aegiribacteria sp.]
MRAKVTYSKSYEAKKSRIRRLPRIAQLSMFAHVKRDAYGLVDEFQQGIRNGTLGLRRLKSSTIRQKRRKGYPRPGTPLYGKGDTDKRSYINMLRVRKERKGYRVYQSRGMHHSGRISLRALYEIHEYGTVIQQGKATIVIPPRPAFHNAFREYMHAKARQEPAKEVRRVIIQHVNEGEKIRQRRTMERMGQ